MVFMKLVFRFFTNTFKEKAKEDVMKLKTFILILGLGFVSPLQAETQEITSETKFFATATLEHLNEAFEQLQRENAPEATNRLYQAHDHLERVKKDIQGITINEDDVKEAISTLQSDRFQAQELLQKIRSDLQAELAAYIE